MSVASFESVQDHRLDFIRKALEGSIFVKPWAEADPEITQIYTTAGGLLVPTGYVDVGVINKEAATAWARETDSNDTTSWGYAEPTRRDMTQDTTTMAFSMQESKRTVMELYNGADLSGVVPDAQGNVVIDKPARPQAKLWRAFQLCKDGDGADAIYFARIMPRCQVTGIDNQTWGEENEILYPVTLTGYRDSVWGTAVREIWGGPGLDAAAMGFGS